MEDSDTVCLGTEEMVAEIDRVNTSKPSGDLIIGLADVRVLYPSLDIDFTVHQVCDMLTVTEVKFQGLWYKEIGLYLKRMVKRQIKNFYWLNGL